MKRRVLITVLVFAIAGVIWFSGSHRPPVAARSIPETARENSHVSEIASQKVAAAVQSVREAPVADGPVLSKPKPKSLAAMAEPPVGPEVGPGLTPVVVMENMRAVFRNYSQRFGGNPVGINREITAALNGRNPAQAVFIDADAGLRINEQGQLVDNWGTPFFFHQLSRMEMEIHSAGPDRRMWTADDLVIK